MKRDCNKIHLLCENKQEVLSSIIQNAQILVTSRPEKSLYDLISLILFFKLCKNNPFILSGTNNINIPNHPKGSQFNIEIQPAKIIDQLEEYLIITCDKDIQEYYRCVLNYKGKDFFTINNLQNIIEYENLKRNNPTNNQKYGELAKRILDDLNSLFWNDEKDITLTQKYSFIYNILCKIGLIELEEELSDNDKLHKIAKYLKSYDTFIAKNKNKFWAKTT